jgi:hypothetical protein
MCPGFMELQVAMKNFGSVARGLSFVLLAFATHGAAAQSDSESERGRGGGEVCVYEHANYRGWEQCYRVGEAIPDLGDRRNQISSIRSRGGAQVELYEHPNFGGRDEVFSDDVPDLSRERGSWNDQVDSLRVSSSRSGGRPHDSRPQRDDRVCVYEHVDYQGSSRCWEPGEEVRDLKGSGWNDGISSIRSFGRVRATFYEHNDFRGQRLTVDRDIADLTRTGGRDRSHWNDRISSLRVSGGR